MPLLERMPVSLPIPGGPWEKVCVYIYIYIYRLHGNIIGAQKPKSKRNLPLNSVEYTEHPAKSPVQAGLKRLFL